MPKKKKKKSITLEQIVHKAQKKEASINRTHPERCGYGMTEEEAKPFIGMLYHLAYQEDHAQRERNIDRCQRVQMIGRDKLYSLSPEQILLRREQMQIIVDRLTAIRKDLTEDEKEVYDEYYLDKLSQAEIAENMKTSQPQISRIINNINKALAIRKEALPECEPNQ